MDRRRQRARTRGGGVLKLSSLKSIGGEEEVRGKTTTTKTMTTTITRKTKG